MTGKISDDPDKVVDGSEKVAAAAGGDNYGILIASIATYLASVAQTLSSKTINAASNTISNLATSMFAAGVIDTDGTLAANSDTKIASQKAVKTAVDAAKTYADGLVAAQDAMVFKGVTDCSANPNYPAADRGHTYRVSVAGKIGGASGVVVEAGDIFICLTDGTAAGNQATVGASWGVIQTNIDGAVVGPASVTDDLPAIFDGTTGKLIKSKTYAAFKTLLVLVKGDVGLGNVDNTSDATKNAAAVALTSKTINAASNTISNLATSMFAAGVIDTDGTLAANSDTKIASQKAVKTAVDAAKTYADGLVAAQDAMVFKGVTDCSANPNYPAADRGHTYRVSVAGKIGGASGVVVEAGDMFICLTDSTAAGNQATVGASWSVIQTNIDGAVVGPAGVTDDLPAIFDGTTGKLLKSKTYAAFKTLLVLVKGDVGLGNVQNVVEQYGQCVLAKSGANLALTPKNGNLLSVNGVACTVPDAGVTLAATSLTPGTLYYIYATASAGAVNALEASATAYAVSTTAGNKGVVIKSGDDARTLVGMARPITGPAWSDLINQRFVRSWFNEAGVAVSASLTADRTTTSVALTYAEVNSELRCEALVWSGEVFFASWFGAFSNSNSGQSSFVAIGYDGVTAESPASMTDFANGNVYSAFSISTSKAGLAEGYHYATGLGAVSANTGKWRGVNSPCGVTGRVGR